MCERMRGREGRGREGRRKDQHIYKKRRNRNLENTFLFNKKKEFSKSGLWERRREGEGRGAREGGD